MNCCLMILTVVVFIAAAIIILKVFLKLSIGWDRSPTCLVGKTAIITGANTGLGFYTAQDFAKRGARVILACRDAHQAEEAKRKIVEATGNSNVVVKIVDLSSLASVRDFANDINSTEDRLDILVNNAGAGGFKHTITGDGLSLIMQTNHFGPFLLTLLLIGLLKKSAPSRIVNVSSTASHFASLNLNDLNSAPTDTYFVKIRDYSNTKLCNILFTNELARKLKGSGVVANSLHPGVVQTDLFRNLPSSIRAFTNLFYKTAEEGAQTSIYVAVSNDISGVSGAFFTECKKGWMPKAARNDELAIKLWQKSEEFVKLTEEEQPFA